MSSAGEPITSTRPESGHDVSTGLAMGWSAGAACTSLAATLVGQLLLVFMTSRLGMAPALAGGVLSINKFIGLGLDPAVGALSDRTRTRIGRRRPWLLAGSLLLPLSLLALFAPPAGLVTGGAQAAYYTAAILLFGAGYSVFRIPYLTMSAEMTTDSGVRARMISFKIVAIAVGTLLGSALAPVLVDWFGADRAAYGKSAAVLAALALCAGLLCFFATRGARYALRPTDAPAFGWAQVKSLFANRPFAALAGAKLLFSFGATFGGACAAYFVIFVMGQRVSILGLYYFIFTVLTMISQPLWLRVVRARDNRTTFVASTLVYAVLNLGWLVLAHTPSLVLLAILGSLLGLATGGVQLALEASLPDLMELDARRTGLRREGAFAAIFSLVEKLTSAIGLALVGAFLQMSGFVQSLHDVAQPASAQLAIVLSMSVIPSALVSVAAVAIWLWGMRPSDRLDVPAR